MIIEHWITRHWPHPADDDLAWNVYLKEDEREKAQEVKRGDKILFYRVEKMLVDGRRRNFVRRIRDGAMVELGRGKGAIIRVGVVTATVRARPPVEIQYDYGIGDPFEWRYEIKCASGEVGVPVIHRTVKEVLGYNMRFPGSFRQIAPDKYQRICQLSEG